MAEPSSSTDLVAADLDDSFKCQTLDEEHLVDADLSSGDMDACFKAFDKDK